MAVMINSKGKPQKRHGGRFERAAGPMIMTVWLPLNANHTLPGRILCEIGPWRWSYGMIRRNLIPRRSLRRFKFGTV
jgi:hypothetical protein